MDRVRVDVESLAYGGDGVGRLPDGRTVFVPASCPGDVLDVQITENHPRWARAATLEIVVPSSDRVTPQCPYFGVCGGCQWQHVAYGRQAASKQAAVRDALTRIGKVEDAQVAPVIESPSAYGYRNKIELTATTGARGLVLGLSAAASHEIVPVDACLLLPERSRGLPGALAGALRFLAARGALGIFRVTLRVSSAGQVAVDLWTTGGPFPRAAVAKTVAEATGARTVTRVIVRGEPARRDISKVEVLAGPGVWRESLGGDRYTVSAPSFFQVNTQAAEVLRSVATEAVAADGTSRVADLYAGVGTFTLPLARAAGSTVAIESSRYALSDLRRNLADARLDVDVVPGDAAHTLGGLGHLDAVLIDPPRSGLTPESTRTLLAARADRIVYVSCDPSTLARDVQHFTSAGYVLTSATPVDLFPQTFHIETVAVLDRT